MISASLKFAPADGFVEYYDALIYFTNQTLQLKKITTEDIGQDGLYTVLFNHSSLTPGDTYDIMLITYANKYENSININTTLGEF